jgi:thiol:disulfide interchange protein/DsbC/DsbD-like thiol-disulfide interchange protein
MKIAITNMFLSLLVGLLLIIAPPTHALESQATKTSRDVVTLVSDVDVVQPGKVFHLGLRFRLTPGWHIYWLNPGDAGQPPAMQMVLPDGIKASEIAWPTPLRIAEGPAMVYAYQGDVTLPVAVSVPSSLQTKSFDVDVNANWLVCADVCKPEQGVFHLALPIGTAKPSPEADLFAASVARQPHPSPFTTQISNHDLLVFDKNLSPQTISDAWFFPYAWGVIDHAAPQKLSFNSKGLALTLKPGLIFDPKAKLSGVLVLKNSQGQENYYSIVAPPDKTAVALQPQSGMGLILLFAFLGGFILNLMPCVFPILAMKALSIVKLSGTDRSIVRGEALFYTLGVLVTFTLLDGILLIFRMAGKAVGWGFQFQSPVFVMVIAWLLFALGLNFSGAYLIGGRLMGIGERYTKHKGYVGSFFTGLLVVVVATPCVAPFIGAAVAAALAASPVGMLGIFLAMGFGLALPYTMLAVFPDCVRILPRPGRWMEIFRQVLAFPMYGASVWLVWVLSLQVGPDGVVMALTGIVIIWFVIWLFGTINANTSVFAKSIAFSFIALALFLMFEFLHQVSKPLPVAVSRTEVSDSNEPYSAARLASLRSQGKAVFVNMTAAWCITCLVNEKVALATDSVKETFARQHITYLIGDWTEQKPEISAFLQEYHHEGVPLYVFYPAGMNAVPVVLPQILTKSIIIDAINSH